MPDVLMPRLSDSMEKGTIVRWLVPDGECVNSSTDVVEIETDKALVSVAAGFDGVLNARAATGETVPVGALIATISDKGADTVRVIVATDADASSRPKVSPIARRRAKAHGVDLATVSGTGPNGRVTNADIEAALRVASQPAAPAQVTDVKQASTAQAESSVDERAAEPGIFEKLTRTQRTIARRMAEAKQNVPEFTLTVDVAMDAAVALRDQIRDARIAPLPSFNDLVVSAAATALRRHPRANGSYVDGALELHQRVNVGIAVTAEGSLFVPTIFDADRKSLTEIAADSKALGERARNGRLRPDEMSGGTFTVSNLGMFGITNFVAILNEPQAAILAVGAVEERIIVDAHAPAVGHRMTLTLTCDHRVLYGADGAALLSDIRANLEQPVRLLLSMPD